MNDMERIQTGVKLHELETILAVYYSYLETDRASTMKQTFSLPHPALQSQVWHIDLCTWQVMPGGTDSLKAQGNKYLHQFQGERQRLCPGPCSPCMSHGCVPVQERCVQGRAGRWCWGGWNQHLTSISCAHPGAAARSALPAKEKQGKHSFSGTAPPRGDV